MWKRLLTLGAEKLTSVGGLVYCESTCSSESHVTLRAEKLPFAVTVTELVCLQVTGHRERLVALGANKWFFPCVGEIMYHPRNA